jgi:hypothetical protein
VVTSDWWLVGPVKSSRAPMPRAGTPRTQRVRSRTRRNQRLQRRSPVRSPRRPSRVGPRGPWPLVRVPLPGRARGRERLPLARRRPPARAARGLQSGHPHAVVTPATWQGPPHPAGVLTFNAARQTPRPEPGCRSTDGEKRLVLDSRLQVAEAVAAHPVIPVDPP